MKVVNVSYVAKDSLHSEYHQMTTVVFPALSRIFLNITLLGRKHLPNDPNWPAR